MRTTVKKRVNTYILVAKKEKKKKRKTQSVKLKHVFCISDVLPEVKNDV